MKVCPECGYSNPDNTDYCHKCGRNLKANIVKASNASLKNILLFKLDKKTGEIRIAKTKVISWTSFSVIFLSIISVGLFSNTPIWAFIVVGFLIGAIVALVLYLVGYGIAGLIEKLDFLT